jgi:hypothetical protein
MSTIQKRTFEELNQRYLTADIARVKEYLEAAASNPGYKHQLARDTGENNEDLASIRREMEFPPAIETICTAFNLSRFEQDVLLLCAGMELDSAFAGIIGKSGYKQPSFSLALAAFPGAHWSAITPDAPLRYWRLIELTEPRNLTAGGIRIDESILHYIAGLRYYDERLEAYIKSAPAPGMLVPSHQNILRQARAVFEKGSGSNAASLLQLYGNDTASQMSLASSICEPLGMDLYIIDARGIPNEPREAESLARLWDREAALTRGALLLDCSEAETGDKVLENLIGRFIENIHTFLIIGGRERRQLQGRASVSFEVLRPAPAEQLAYWKQCLSNANMNGKPELLVSQFDLSITDIGMISGEALEIAGSGSDFGTVLWETCRVHTRRRMDELAQRIHSGAALENLVLPDGQRQTLTEIAAQVRNRMKVYRTWGFGSRISRGLGITALFTGPSGTGKTMAAEVLSNELHLDLYRIDLSQVVSKYIGETEKNLRKVFDAAEGGGAILLFDEADALFGKRSEVKDSHDRYANIEVSYLLQRMEDYQGLAILTTNMKEAIDTAFLRRLRFIVQFPFPNPEQRKKIWQTILPEETPTRDLDVEKLAKLNVSGGTIRNIALYAAFLAAGADEPVTMKHLLRAARAEYGKLETSLTEAEIRGWV